MSRRGALPAQREGAQIYEGTSRIQTLMQAEYALGYRQDRPLRCPCRRTSRKSKISEESRPRR